MVENPNINLNRKKSHPDKILHKGVRLKRWFIVMCITSMLIATGCVVGGGGTPCITSFRATEAQITLTALAVENVMAATQHPGALEASALTQAAVLAQRPVVSNCKPADELSTYAAGTLQAIGTKNAGPQATKTAEAEITGTSYALQTEQVAVGKTLEVILATGLAGTAQAEATAQPGK